jgi:hypothetical protein
MRDRNEFIRSSMDTYQLSYCEFLTLLMAWRENSTVSLNDSLARIGEPQNPEERKIFGEITSDEAEAVLHRLLVRGYLRASEEIDDLYVLSHAGQQLGKHFDLSLQKFSSSTFTK